jgi:sterol desaturase/sphingolipid hydroxylase (fatty acid hydroxylase superfamily)
VNTPVFGIENFEVYGTLGILVFFGLIELMAGYLRRSNRTADDWIQEAGAFFVLALILKPGVVFIAFILGRWLIPSFQDSFAGLSLLIALPAFLLIDDFIQYWYHRFSHEWNWLWKLHRPHHQAEEMGFFVSFRNSGFYYVLFPPLWWFAFFVFLGGAEAAIIGVVFKQLIVISSHSLMTWDRFFYRYRIFHGPMTLIERIVITPAFHYSHHGKSNADGISEPNGNYGNMFSIWDQFFGTARFSRVYPTDLGLQDDPKEGWAACFFYPLIASRDPRSELFGNFRQKP